MTNKHAKVGTSPLAAQTMEAKQMAITFGDIRLAKTGHNKLGSVHSLQQTWLPWGHKNLYLKWTNLLPSPKFCDDARVTNFSHLFVTFHRFQKLKTDVTGCVQKTKSIWTHHVVLIIFVILYPTVFIIFSKFSYYKYTCFSISQSLSNARGVLYSVHKCT